MRVTLSDCDTFGCSQICIIESSGARCLCEDGYSLSGDGKTCTGKGANSYQVLWKYNFPEKGYLSNIFGYIR